MEREQVLDAYRNGDQDKRLSLFLGYRELRAEFGSIDQESEAVRPITERDSKWLKWITGYP